MFPTLILLGSNNGIDCEVLAVNTDPALIHNEAMAQKANFSIVTSFGHHVRTDGPLPEVGLKFSRPAQAPLKRNLNQSWYAEEQLALFNDAVEKAKSL